MPAQGFRWRVDRFCTRARWSGRPLRRALLTDGSAWAGRDQSIGAVDPSQRDSWNFNVGDSSTAITMPANSGGGGGAVPGIGGLAGLAMGAAGMRRKRQRVA